MCETKTGQLVAQLHDSYMIMIMMVLCQEISPRVCNCEQFYVILCRVYMYVYVYMYTDTHTVIQKHLNTRVAMMNNAARWRRKCIHNLEKIMGNSTIGCILHVHMIITE